MGFGNWELTNAVRKLLIQLDSSPHPSVFDGVVARDGGADDVMAYGGVTLPLRRALPLELSLVGTVALCALLYAITRWKDKKLRAVRLTGPWRILSPVLK